jgi:PAS domain S-box-containing protein
MQGHAGPQVDSPGSARRHSWLLAAAAAAGVLVVGVVLASGLPQPVRHGVSTVALLGVGLALVAACRDRYLHNRGRRKRAWLLFSFAAVFGTLGNLWVSLFGYSEPVMPIPLGDVSLILALLLGIAGLLTYPSAPRRGLDLTRMILDGVVLGGSVLLIAADTLFPQILNQPGPNLAARAAPLAAPVIDLILATVGWLLFTRGSRIDRPALAMASTGFALFAISDGLAAVERAQGTFSFGSPIDLGWIAGYTLLTVGVLWSVNPPSPGAESSPEHSAVAGTMVMFGMLVIAAFLHLSTGTTSPTSDALLVLVLLAVSGRQTLLTLDNEVLRRDLEKRVIERSTEAREATQRSDLLVDSVADGVYGVDGHGLVTFMNPAALAALGFPRTAILGHQAHTLFHDHGIADNAEENRDQGANERHSQGSCYLTTVISDGVAVSGVEDFYKDADGRLIPVEVTASPLAGDGHIRGAVVVFRDVTQRREVDRMKNEFVSMVSHELRTPLTAIRGSLGLLAGGALGELAPPATRMVEIAVDSSRRLTRLIDQILDLERIESGTLPLEIGHFPATELIDAAMDQIRIIAEAAGVRVRVTSAEGIVISDADRVVQTLLNLLSNAVKFSPSGSEVTVSSSIRTDSVEFCIEDSGRGIPEDKLETVFVRFEQVDSSDAREKGGTGLGLAISRSLIERLGGRIWAENRTEGGARFRFILPRAVEPSADGPAHLLALEELEAARLIESEAAR